MNQEKPGFPVSLIVFDAIGTAFLAVGLLGLFAPDIATTLLPVMADRNTTWICIGIGAALILFATSEIIGHLLNRPRP